MTVDKRELVAGTARRTDLTRAQTRQVLEAILDTVAAALANGDEVVLRDFGRFSTWERQQTVRDFDGAKHKVDVPQIRFNASATLRRRLYEDPACTDDDTVSLS